MSTYKINDFNSVKFLSFFNLSPPNISLPLHPSQSLSPSLPTSAFLAVGIHVLWDCIEIFQHNSEQFTSVMCSFSFDIIIMFHCSKFYTKCCGRESTKEKWLPKCNVFYLSCVFSFFSYSSCAFRYFSCILWEQ